PVIEDVLDRLKDDDLVKAVEHLGLLVEPTEVSGAERGGSEPEDPGTPPRALDLSWVEADANGLIANPRGIKRECPRAAAGRQRAERPGPQVPPQPMRAVKDARVPLQHR